MRATIARVFLFRYDLKVGVNALSKCCWFHMAKSIGPDLLAVNRKFRHTSFYGFVI
jgi:hypothetical protein